MLLSEAELDTRDEEAGKEQTDESTQVPANSQPQGEEMK